MYAHRQRWLIVISLAALLATTGCVRRRMTVRSDPPGARVYVDDRDIGLTPCSSYYTYYGTRQVRIVKDGFQTETVERNFKAPWYEWPPLDFISENLWPAEIRDERVLDFQLVPQRIVPTEELLQRAEGLRQGVSSDVVVPLPNLPTGAGEPPPSLNGAPSLPLTPSAVSPVVPLPATGGTPSVSPILPGAQ
jgi:PEGA domain